MKYSDINYLELEQSRGLREHVFSLSDEFMKAFKLSHICITKEYFDGQYCHLSNDFTWKEYWVANNHYRDFARMFYTNLKGNTQKPQFFMWQSQPSHSADLMDYTYRYGIHSGFNIIIMQDDHLENYGFGSSLELMELINILPTQAELEMFCIYLRECIFKTNLLRDSVMGNTGFSFTPQNHKKRHAKIPLPQTFSLQCNGQENKLSHRELTCLGLLAQGYGQKDTAQLLNISHRTVEFHLTQVKLKFKNPSKSDLITTFRASHLGTIDPLFLLELDKE